MPDLSFVTTCMGRLAHVVRTLPLLAAQPGCETILVDYSCPEHAGDWAAANVPGVKVIRIPGESEFRLSRARNAGAAVATAPWLCFIDADVLIGPTFAAEVLPLLVPGRYFRPDNGVKDLAGTVVLARADFDRVGGYDEAFNGWGTEDTELYARYHLRGVLPAEFPGRLVAAIDHNDALRLRFHEDKNVWRTLTRNRVYAQAKLDLMAMTARDLTADELGTLYAKVREEVERVYTVGSDGWVRIDVRTHTLPEGRAVTTTLTYSITTVAPAG